jgi:hypothetical protein
MASTLRFDKWENAAGTEIASAENGFFSSQGIRQDFASFGSTSAITLGNSTPVKIAYNRALHASSDMSWAYDTANGTIPAYNWKHSKTGFYRLAFWARTTADVWMAISVCTDNVATSSVGVSARTGSASGYGYSAELIYKVSDISKTFSLFHWGASSAGAMSGFSGTPPTGFVPTPQNGGAAPADGYFILFNITPVSSL